MKLLYRPFALVLGMLGGMAASRLFRTAWRLAAGEEDAPKATDRARGVGEVVAAAALRGAVFSGVAALVSRLGAAQFERLTGTWPGSTDSDKT
jgi:Protein of unknown function (DUF4235)